MLKEFLSKFKKQEQQTYTFKFELAPGNKYSSNNIVLLDKFQIKESYKAALIDGIKKMGDIR